VDLGGIKLNSLFLNRSLCVDFGLTIGPLLAFKLIEPLRFEFDVWLEKALARDG
jgi:hypothetical protein